MNTFVVLSAVLAAVAANPSGLGWGAGLGGWGGAGLGGWGDAGLGGWGGAGLGGWGGAGLGGWGGAWGGVAAPLAAAGAIGPVTSVAAAPLNLAHNYRGPVSLAPGQPANILAQDGRPLDTLSVNLDRAAHLTARAVNNGHVLKKRSLVAPIAVAPVARVIAPIAAVNYAGVGAWGNGAWGNGAWGNGAWGNGAWGNGAWGNGVWGRGW